MSTSKRAVSTEQDSFDSSKRNKNDVDFEILPNGFEEKKDVEVWIVSNYFILFLKKYLLCCVSSKKAILKCLLSTRLLLLMIHQMRAPSLLLQITRS